MHPVKEQEGYHVFPIWLWLHVADAKQYTNISSINHFPSCTCRRMELRNLPFALNNLSILHEFYELLLLLRYFERNQCIAGFIHIFRHKTISTLRTLAA